MIQDYTEFCPDPFEKKATLDTFLASKIEKTDVLTCKTSEKFNMSSISDILFWACFGRTLENENIFGSSWG